MERPYREALGPAPRAPQRAAQGPPPHPLPLTRPAPRQEPGDVFVLGDGDCGQFGKGEDVTEALRPTPSPLPEGAGQARRAALPAGCAPRGRSFRAVRICASCPAFSSACGSCAIDAAEGVARQAPRRPGCCRVLAVSTGSGAAGRRWCRWPRAACTARRSRPAARCSPPASTTRARSAAGRVRRRGAAAPPRRSGARACRAVSQGPFCSRRAAPCVPCGGLPERRGPRVCVRRGVLQPCAQPLAGPGHLADEVQSDSLRAPGSARRPARCAPGPSPVLFFRQHGR